jgi:NIMA (never in mitosis gene a)-related kinase
MEYADDGDLYQKIVEKKKRSETFAEEEIWRMLIQVTKGLKALHNLNIFHRDLKVSMTFNCSQQMCF